jgi:hypothetical protein
MATKLKWTVARWQHDNGLHEIQFFLIVCSKVLYFLKYLLNLLYVHAFKVLTIFIYKMRSHLTIF